VVNTLKYEGPCVGVEPEKAKPYGTPTPHHTSKVRLIMVDTHFTCISM